MNKAVDFLQERYAGEQNCPLLLGDYTARARGLLISKSMMEPSVDSSCVRASFCMNLCTITTFTFDIHVLVLYQNITTQPLPFLPPHVSTFRTSLESPPNIQNHTFSHTG